MDKIDRLRSVLSKNTDPFDNGDVIRWSSLGRYIYAAIRTPSGWCTTATSSDMYVSPVLEYEDLVAVLNRAETTGIEVSSGWIWVDY